MSVEVRYWIALGWGCLVLMGCHRHSEHHYQGYVEGEPIYIASPFSGQLMQSHVKRGEKVKKGDRLFVLDDNPQVQSIADAEALLRQGEAVLRDLELPRRKPEIDAILAQIDQANAQINLAELRYHRNETLYTKHAIDKDTVDGAKEKWIESIALKAQYLANLDLAKLGAREYQVVAQKDLIQSLQAKLAQAQWQLAQKTLLAPEDGLIFDTFYYEGEFVPAAYPIAALLTPSHWRIEFFIPSEDLPIIRVGAEIFFICKGCKDNNAAIVDYISPTVEYAPPLVYSRENNEKLVFRVKARLINPERYAPGMPVEVTNVQEVLRAHS